MSSLISTQAKRKQSTEQDPGDQEKRKKDTPASQSSHNNPGTVQTLNVSKSSRDSQSRVVLIGREAQALTYRNGESHTPGDTDVPLTLFTLDTFPHIDTFSAADAASTYAVADADIAIRIAYADLGKEKDFFLVREPFFRMQGYVPDDIKIDGQLYRVILSTNPESEFCLAVLEDRAHRRDYTYYVDAMAEDRLMYNLIVNYSTVQLFEISFHHSDFYRGKALHSSHVGGVYAGEFHRGSLDTVRQSLFRPPDDPLPDCTQRAAIKSLCGIHAPSTSTDGLYMKCHSSPQDTLVLMPFIPSHVGPLASSRDLRESFRDRANNGGYLENPNAEVEMMEYIRRLQINDPNPGADAKLFSSLLAYGLCDQSVYVITSLLAGEMSKKSDSDLKAYMKRLFTGVAYLHKHNIAHHDVKPENVACMSDNPSGAVILDFGQAVHTGRDPGIISPENLAATSALTCKHGAVVNHMPCVLKSSSRMPLHCSTCPEFKQFFESNAIATISSMIRLAENWYASGDITALAIEYALVRTSTEWHGTGTAAIRTKFDHRTLPDSHFCSDTARVAMNFYDAYSALHNAKVAYNFQQTQQTESAVGTARAHFVATCRSDNSDFFIFKFLAPTPPPPPLQHQLHYCAKCVDMWMLGTILSWELTGDRFITGAREVYSDDSNEESGESDDDSDVERNHHPEPPQISAEWVGLLDGMLNEDMDQRFTAEQALQHLELC